MNKEYFLSILVIASVAKQSSNAAGLLRYARNDENTRPTPDKSSP